MKCKKQECRFVFLGVFLLGILGIWMTGKYYLKKEPYEDREARSRRVAAEVSRFNETKKAALTTLHP